MRFATLLSACAALAIAAPAAVRAESYEVETPATREGEPTIILAKRPGQTATLRIGFSVGAVEDGTRYGITHLAQLLLVDANRRIDRERLVLGVHASAGSFAVETGLRDCSFTLTADRRDFPELARMLAVAVLQPQVEAGMFRRAVERALLDLAAGRNDDRRLSMLASFAVDDTRYTNAPHGDAGSVESFEFAEAVAHQRAYLVPANATVVVTGSFDRDAVLRMLRSFRGGTGHPTSRAKMALPIKVRRPAPRETHVVAYDLRVATPRDAAAARLATALLQDELWRRFRMAGVGYGFGVTPIVARWLEALLVVVPAHDPSSLDLGPFLDEAIARVRDGGYDDRQLASARAAAETDLAAEDRSPEALALALARGGATWHGAPVAGELAALDRAALSRILGGWMAAERKISIYLGPRP
jgi:hypothetical protein